MSADTTSHQSDQEDRIPLQRAPSLYILPDTPKGRGVFSSTRIAAGTTIDTCPVLVLSPAENAAHIAQTELYHYTYNWPIPRAAIEASATTTTTTTTTTTITTADDPPRRLPAPAHTQAVVLGLGSMFNHSVARQNVGWRRDVVRLTITYFALRDIPAGEELCISYGDRLTFVDADRDDEEDAVHADDGEGMLGRIGLAFSDESEGED